MKHKYIGNTAEGQWQKIRTTVDIIMQTTILTEITCSLGDHVESVSSFSVLRRLYQHANTT